MANDQLKTYDNKRDIRIFTLGQFKIERDNRPYHFSGRSTKLWTLFLFFIINRHTNMAPEIILEYLNPEKDYEDPLNAAQNMIYRLRKLITTENIFNKGKDIILFTNGGYQLNMPDNLWIDLDELEQNIKKAELIKDKQPVESIKFYEKALSLYHGDLLPQLIYEEWIIPQRTYYQGLYQKSLMQLCDLYSKQKDYDEIIRLCKNAVAIDPYEEKFHIQLMMNLLKTGRIKDAKEHYEATIEFFEKEFGIQPTPEMQKMSQLLKTDFIAIKSDGSGISGQVLKNEDKENGAFLCHYRDFYAIYVLEKRRCERSGDAFCPVYVDFDQENILSNSQATWDLAIKEFKLFLTESLRKGDVITVINGNQFLVLLHNADYQIVKMVLNRVFEKFQSRTSFKNISPRIKVCTSLSRKNNS